MVNWTQLIEERNAWVAHNFPGDEVEIEGSQSVIGMYEEFGELCHSWLKRKQNIRGNEDLEATGRDSVGDLIVYMLGLLNAVGHTPRPWGPAHGVKDIRDKDLEDYALHRVGAAIGGIAKGMGAVIRRGPQAFFAKPAIDKLVYWLERYCELEGWDFEDIIYETWAEVKKRDWIAYPDTGLPPVPVQAVTPQVDL